MGGGKAASRPHRQDDDTEGWNIVDVDIVSVSDNMPSSEQSIHDNSGSPLATGGPRKMTIEEEGAIYKCIEYLQGISIPELRDQLIQRGLLGLQNGDRELIEGEKTEREKISRMLQLVAKKHDFCVFDNFLLALEECSNAEHIVSRIRHVHFEKPIEVKMRFETSDKNVAALGMLLADGKDEPRWKGDNRLYIRHLDYNGLAKTSGYFKVWDTIHKVNGHHVAELPLGEAMQRLRKRPLQSITYKRRMDFRL